MICLGCQTDSDMKYIGQQDQVAHLEIVCELPEPDPPVQTIDQDVGNSFNFAEEHINSKSNSRIEEEEVKTSFIDLIDESDCMPTPPDTEKIDDSQLNLID